MYPLVESIRAEDGHFFLLDYHQDRLEHTFRELYRRLCPWKLKDILLELPSKGLFKIRFLYNDSAYSIEVLPYTSREIKSLKLVDIGEYTYPHKWTNRSEINKAFEKRGNCDDILMVKNGLLTDASYANIVLFDGTDWFTPDIPLFKGVQRAFLLDHKTIQTASISSKDLTNFKGFQLINAMNPMDSKRFALVKGIE